MESPAEPCPSLNLNAISDSEWMLSIKVGVAKLKFSVHTCQWSKRTPLEKILDPPLVR